MLDSSMTFPVEFQKAIGGLKDIPTDIEPEFVTATAIARAAASSAKPSSGAKKKSVRRRR
jgi:hypothetical protein